MLNRRMGRPQSSYLGITVAFAVLSGLPCGSSIGRAAPPVVPPAFAEELDRLNWEEDLRLEDAVAVDLKGAEQRFVAHLVPKNSEMADQRLMVLKAGSPVTIEFREASMGFKLGGTIGADSRELCGKDINGDGYPEVIAMTERGGTGLGTMTVVILTLTPSGVRSIYRGTIFRMADLDRDGFPEIVTLEEGPGGNGGGGSPHLFTALKWSGSKYVRTPSLERGRLFKAATTLPTLTSAENPLVTGEPSADYFPMAVGTVWEYRMPRVKGIIKTEVIVDVAGKSDVRIYWLHKTGPIVSVFGKGLTQITIYPDGRVDGGPSVRLPLRPGLRWADANWTFEVSALPGVVTTPAGAFKRCLRVARHCRHDCRATDTKTPNPFASMFEDYAPGVGFVRAGFLDPPQETTMELVKYTARELVKQ